MVFPNVRGAPQLAQNALPTLLDWPHCVHNTPDIDAPCSIIGSRALTGGALWRGGALGFGAGGCGGEAAGFG